MAPRACDLMLPIGDLALLAHSWLTKGWHLSQRLTSCFDAEVFIKGIKPYLLSQFLSHSLSLQLSPFTGLNSQSLYSTGQLVLNGRRSRSSWNRWSVWDTIVMEHLQAPAAETCWATRSWELFYFPLWRSRDFMQSSLYAPKNTGLWFLQHASVLYNLKMLCMEVLNKEIHQLIKTFFFLVL